MKETCAIVFSYEETYEHSYNTTSPNYFLDRDAMLYLSDAIGGFMVRPTALYKGEVLAAKQLTINNLAQFKRRVCNKNTFIYTVEFKHSYPIYYAIDDATQRKVFIEPYIRNISAWVIRYAVAGE